MSDKTDKLGPLATGVEVIAEHVKNLPATPGVYRMIAENGEVLYVGKAKALKKRVEIYTRPDRLPIRLQRMIFQTAKMEFVNTHTEVEALLLESNLIKKLKPRYNILLRDDKSFPYILITGDHDFPQLKKHRGVKKGKKVKGGGEYFGPFASAGAVNHTIEILQRGFKLRNCSDSVFANRSRPCLQYHIKRCTAPCVGKISKADYTNDVAQARRFLTGESKKIQDDFAHRMQEESDAENFEKAAEYRDRIKVLSAIQAQQDINLKGLSDVDVMALSQREGKSCVQVFFFRGGQNFGNRAYFPRHDKEETEADIITLFIAQFYENKPVPLEVLCNIKPREKKLLEEALSTKRERGKVKISVPARGKCKRVIEFVIQNAKSALKRNLAMRAGEKKHLEALAELFSLSEIPKRIEVYDNSHISGSNMVGAMIVAGQAGFNKGAYRKFNIRKAQGGDDYAMMREVITRRFSRALKESVQKDSDNWPDLLLIDGGKGQLSAVSETLRELGVYEDLCIVAIAKGEDRNAGREQFFMNGRKPFQLPISDSTLHYLQRLRDEAHRVAIGAHRNRRKMGISKSPLDQIPGVGGKRKKALLLRFGSAKAVATAGVEDLRQVEGISRALAEKIYGFFNEN